MFAVAAAWREDFEAPLTAVAVASAAASAASVAVLIVPHHLAASWASIVIVLCHCWRSGE
jgi:hypothetical protein